MKRRCWEALLSALLNYQQHALQHPNSVASETPIKAMKQKLIGVLLGVCVCLSSPFKMSSFTTCGKNKALLRFTTASASTQ